MSPRASLGLSRLALAAGCALASSALAAQTIADYSRAQRAMLEGAMAQAAARAAGLAASAPSVAAQAPFAAAAAAVQPQAQALPAPPMRPLPAPGATGPRVGGVFVSAAGALVEVDVDGAPYMLAAGQAVPGTPWRVESASIDRVVLARREPGASGDAGAPEPVRRVFALPPLR